MRLSSLLTLFATFAVAAILSLVAASLSADLIENTSQESVEIALHKEGLDWTEVHAEGLQVFVTGVAPTEAARFKAISVAGGVVDAARVIDNMQVEATAAIAPPRFSVEMLRNEAGISLIGLMPEASNREDVVKRIIKLAGDAPVTDLLETAAYTPPAGWTGALDYGLFALDLLPKSKISVEADRVTIRAMTDSLEHRVETEGRLTRRAPGNLRLVLDLQAPRPVITPFTLRFLIDEAGPRFDACSADSDKARTRILTAARKAGVPGRADCTIGLGVPTPRWAEAVELAIAGLTELGSGTVTFSDADITLNAAMGTDQALFDKVVGGLENRLPEVFALHATLPAPPEGNEAGVPEFVATLSPEGLVQLRGRLREELTRATTLSYAHARFGSEAVHMAARLDDTLPANWSLRVAAGLDALAQLHNGVLTVTPDMVTLRGISNRPDANDDISRILAEKLDQSDRFQMDVTYNEALDPIAQLPKPEDCVADIQTILKERKLTFEPGSGTLDASAAEILDDIAAVLRDCVEVRIEIQGYTDSQGREEMNLALSQTRATAVLNALHDRRILTSGFVAKGYGEDNPIADNDTEEGREANRRIEFVLIDGETDDATEESTETGAESGGESSQSEETKVDTPNESGDDAGNEAGSGDQGAGDEGSSDQGSGDGGSGDDGSGDAADAESGAEPDADNNAENGEAGQEAGTNDQN
ncbi:OmpA family protein [Shimia biformata]|uniref:OmpA family protein n=1 Tax=Shimia biformata TaxID=1294299 RepID=UPI00195049AF|nr:OmpA family protein [Shimia biformata]